MLPEEKCPSDSGGSLMVEQALGINVNRNMNSVPLHIGISPHFSNLSITHC